MSDSLTVAILVGSSLLAAAAGTTVAALESTRAPPPAVVRSAVRVTNQRFARFAPTALATALLLVTGELPLPALLLVVVANVWLRDEFPFSHFPMYSGGGDRATIVRVTDGADRVVEIGFSPQFLSKLYLSERDAAARRAGFPGRESPDDVRRQAGRRALELLDERAERVGKPQLRRDVRLWEVEIELRDGAIEERRRLVAERPPA